MNDDQDFKGRHKNGREGAFTRNRRLPFNYLIVSILKMGKRGLQREMDSFFKETEDADFSIRRRTKSAFTQARTFLSPEAFLALNHVRVQNYYQNVAFPDDKNHRFLAVHAGLLNL